MVGKALGRDLTQRLLLNAISELMKAASIGLKSKAMEKVKESGLSDDKVTVAVEMVSADLRMPKGLTPDGACIAV